MTQLDLMPDAPRAHRQPQEPIVREALIEDNYRYWLKRAWGAGPCLAIAGLNPSTADGQRDDPTMWREMGFACRWGFGSLIKINVYPFISANPEALKRWIDGPDYGNQMIRNLDIGARAIAPCETFLAAWGNGADRDVLEVWLEELAIDVGRPIAWQCFGTNSDGSPRHTLARGIHRVPDDFTPVPWRAAQ